MCANFWWGENAKKGRLHWKKWTDLTTPKCKGSLGFRDLIIFNKALLAKEVWRIMTNPDSSTAQLFKARYFKHVDIMEASLGTNPSYVWRSLLWAKDTLVGGTFWKIGKGNKVDIHKDNWIPDLRKGRIHSSNPREERAMVKGFFNNREEWDVMRLATICHPHELEAIRKIHLLGTDREDRCYWILERKGHYTVKSVYWSLYNKFHYTDDTSRASSSNSRSSIWDKIWNLQVPPKTKLFIWKVAHDIIGAEANLHLHHISVNLRCILCGFHWASTTHVLFFCQGIKRAWKETGWWKILKRLKHHNIREILLFMEESLTPEDWDIFCTKIWGIWKDRCNITHKPSPTHPVIEKPGS